MIASLPGSRRSTAFTALPQPPPCPALCPCSVPPPPNASHGLRLRLEPPSAPSPRRLQAHPGSLKPARQPPGPRAAPHQESGHGGPGAVRAVRHRGGGRPGALPATGAALATQSHGCPGLSAAASPADQRRPEPERRHHNGPGRPHQAAPKPSSPFCGRPWPAPAATPS